MAAGAVSRGHLVRVTGSERRIEAWGRRPGGYTPSPTPPTHKAITSVTAPARAVGQKWRRVHAVVGQTVGDLQASPGGSRPTPRTVVRRRAGRNGSPSSWWVMVQSEGPSTALCFHLGGGGGPRRRFLRRTARRIMPVPRRRRRRGRAAQQISAVGPGGVRGSDPPGGVTGVQGAVPSLGSETSVSCPPVRGRPGRLCGPDGRVQPVALAPPPPRGPLGGGSDGRPEDDRVWWVRPGAAMPRARVPMGWEERVGRGGGGCWGPGRTTWAHRCSAWRGPRRPVRHNDRLRSRLEGPGR